MASRSETRKVNVYVNTKLANKSIKDLTTQKRKLNNEIRQLTPGTEAYRKKLVELKATNSVLKKHRQEINNVETGWGKVKKSLGPMSGLIAGAFAIGRLVSFGKELLEIQARSIGVNFAFKRLGEEGQEAFDMIKESTRGTLSNLDIKTAINEFSNFNISLKESGTLFEFLAVRAAQTGKSVDELQSSLVEGLSKESKLRIDNLGISAMELNKELEQTPDFVQAVANIAKREIAEAGDILDDTTTSQAKWRAEIENSKEAIANDLGPAWDSFVAGALGAMQRLSGQLKKLFSTDKEILGDRVSEASKTGIEEYKKYVAEIRKSEKEFGLDSLGTDEELAEKSLQFSKNRVEKYRKLLKLQEDDRAKYAKSIGVLTKNLSDEEINSVISENEGKIKAVREYARKEIQVASSTIRIKSDAEIRAIEEKNKRAEQEYKRLVSRLERLQNSIENIRQKQTINNSEDPELEKIKASYQKQIDVAIELEAKKGKIGEEAHAQKLELIKLRDAEIEAYELAKKEKEDAKAIELEQKKQDAELKLQQEILTGYDLAVLNLDTHYQNLIALAEEYGIDTTGIIKKYEDEALAIKQENDKKQLESEKEKNQKISEENVKRLNTQASQFTELGQLAQSYHDQIKENGEQAVEAQRLLTLAKIAFDTASSISSIVAYAASTSPDPITLATKIASGILLVMANMAKAKEAMTVEQKAEGGYDRGSSYNVVGANDGRNYRATYTGKTKAGMLYEPSLVLAAEQGPEYYVPNPLLSNPTVANHVRVIEAIRTGKQFAEGGFDVPAQNSQNTNVTSTENTQVIDLSQFVSVVSRLNTILDGGLFAKISDGTIEEIFSIKEEQDEIRGN